MEKKPITILNCLAFLSLPLLIQAQEATDTVEVKRDLGDWYNKSSLTYSPMVEELLVHADFTYNFSQYHGNAEGGEYDGLFLFSMRKNRFTYYLFCELSKQEYELYINKAKILIENSWFDNVIRIDILTHLYVDIGWRWERDTERLLQNRYVYYTGLGTYAQYLPIFNVSLFAGGGQVEDQWDRSMPMVPATLEDEIDPAGFIIQNGWINFGPRVSLRDRILYRVPLTDFDDWQLILKASINVSLTKFLSVSYQYDLDYYNKVWPMVRKFDEKHIFGFTVKLDWKSGDKLEW